MSPFNLQVEPFEFEAELEVNRNSRDYIRWVQQSLNQIMGLKLAVDGIMGAQTRSAVRSFQQKRGLKPDGIVGTQTEAALKVASAGPGTPTAPSRPSASGGEYTNYQHWFETGGTPPMQPIRAGNQVISLVGGPATFKAMVAALRTATSKGHYIYLINWHLTDNFELIPGDPNSTIQSLLSRASQNGVQVRAMLSGHHGNDNGPAASHIDALANGTAILDDRIVSASSLISVGSHHQKIMIVKGSEGLIAFCGGVDLNPNRLNPGPPASSPSPAIDPLILAIGGVNPLLIDVLTSSNGSGSGSGSGSGGGGGGAPLHDVHCRIIGPAAYDVLRIFLERWQDHPAHVLRDRIKGALLGLGESVPGAAGKCYVQIGRTFGNGRKHSGVPGGYRFAPNGEQTVRRMVLHAISQAQRFIYLEDQYLVNMDVCEALMRVLPRIQHLTIVIPHTSLLESTECPQDFKSHRAAFITPLVAVGGSKVRVFHLHPPGAPNTYVHSKMWIIDDEFAIVGSANCNMRSYTHDSEVMAGIYDPDRNFARQLRIALWAKHLNLSANSPDLKDGVASARFWQSLPPGAHVAPFNHLASVSTGNAPRCRLASWDTHIDPNGS
jgi:phosphatidylserine/phosphatidylglycerophosphate/cardiolipin synthase-like enzyme